MENWTDNGYGSAPERWLRRIYEGARPHYWLAAFIAYVIVPIFIAIAEVYA